MKCSQRDVACEAAIHFYSFNFCASSYKIRALHATTGHKVVECRVCCHIFTAETEMYSYIWNEHSAANKLRDIYMTSSTFMLELRCDAAPHLPSIGLFFFFLLGDSKCGIYIQGFAHMFALYRRALNTKKYEV